jgi:ribosomal protein RSM22 (predicted rRNA methylase)
LKSCTFIEKDGELMTIGKRMSGSHFPHAQWIRGDYGEIDFPKADLVTLSYSLGELPEEKQIPVLLKGWNAAHKALVLIEPGTPRGFDVIRRGRQALIDAGAFLQAPCPHAYGCPMPVNDWCHFSVRLERVDFHREIKDVSLSYEDEKFSYVIAIRQPANPFAGRIVRHPQKRSGHIHFTVCGDDGHLHSTTLSRKEGEKYQRGKKLEWGDKMITDSI